MREVVKKEVMKLLHAGMIYPVQDSECVSSVQVVPKKGGMAVVQNERNELMSHPIFRRKPNASHMCARITISHI
jgi:hypothetical protein